MYRVEGYAFETKEQAQIAKKEEQDVRYIRSRTKMDNPDAVLNLYNKLVLKEMFVTPVGTDFLRELQEYLFTIPYIKNEDILPIPIYGESAEGTHTKDYRKPFFVSTFFAVVFAVAIVGIFIVMWVSADNVNIINYENAVIDRYESWEQELSEKEAQLEEREKELERREAQN